MATSIHPWLLRRQTAKLQTLFQEYDRRVLRLDQLSKSAAFSGKTNAWTAETQALHQCTSEITTQWWAAHGVRVRQGAPGK